MLGINKKEYIYLLTEKGLDLANLILEIVVWSDKHVRAYNPNMNAYDATHLDKEQVVKQVQNEYRQFMEQAIN